MKNKIETQLMNVTIQNKLINDKQKLIFKRNRGNGYSCEEIARSIIITPRYVCTIQTAHLVLFVVVVFLHMQCNFLVLESESYETMTGRSFECQITTL